MNVYLDIETIPAQRADLRAVVRAAVKPPATIKNALTIAEWEEKRRPEAEEEAIAATSFDGGMGQVCVIGWALDDDPPQSVQVKDLSLGAEKEILCEWFAQLRHVYSTSGTRPVVVGHNIVAFDLPFIWKRVMYHGIRPPMWVPRDPKPWSDAVFDTMTQWAGARERISMDRLCLLLELPGKGDVTGADVWPMVQAGRIDDVAAYCRDDVERTRALHRRMTFA